MKYVWDMYRVVPSCMKEKNTCNISSFESVAWKPDSSNSGSSVIEVQSVNSLATSIGRTGSLPYYILNGENFVDAWTVDLKKKKKKNTIDKKIIRATNINFFI